MCAGGGSLPDGVQHFVNRAQAFEPASYIAPATVMYYRQLLLQCCHSLLCVETLEN